MKKIKMILTNRFNPDVRVYKEARYLVEKGYNVEILCWDRENEYKDREVEILDGINIKRFFPYAKYGSGTKQLKAFYRFVRECKKYLKNQDYQYLHCHDLDGIITGFLARDNDSKLIFDMHEIYEINIHNESFRYLVRFIVNAFQKKSDWIIYVNELQAEFMSEKNKKKLIYLPNYPEKINYSGCEKTKSKELNISYIGSVRQYNELKNLMDGCKDIEDVKINIHGSGVAHKDLSDISSNYKNVNVTGKYDFSQSAELYSKADILYALYPTTSMQYISSYPVKLFEAIITKTPIIVSKGTVLEEFINKHKIGFAIDGSDVNEIRKLVEYINNNRNLLKEIERNLEKIQYNYIWDQVVSNLDRIYLI